MSTTFVPVPGAGGDSFYWHLVAPRLRAAGHEALTPTSRLLSLELVQRLARERIGVDAEIADSGRLPALSVPDRLARQLRI
jgi:hypothetical protein